MPAPSHEGAEFQIAARSREGPAVDDQQVALVRLDPVMAIERLTQRPLHRREVHLCASVKAHEPAGAARTQHAYAVEHEQRTAVLERWNGRIATVALYLTRTLTHRLHPRHS